MTSRKRSDKLKDDRWYEIADEEERGKNTKSDNRWISEISRCYYTIEVINRLLHGYFDIKPHIIPRKVISSLGIRLQVDTSFLGMIWTASSEFGTYRLCEQRRFRRACAFAQSRQNLRCSLIQAVSQEEPSDRKRDPWPLWMAGHAQLKFVMTECSKTQICLTGLIWGLIWK